MAAPTKLAQLQAQLDALQAAKASGAATTRKGDTSVELRSLADLNSLIADLEGQIASYSDTGRRTRMIRVRTRSEWQC